MAKYTKQQADNCIIKRCDSIGENKVHLFWDIEVEDENGFSLEWKDEQTAGDADDATLKAAIEAFIMTCEKQAVPADVPTCEERADLINTKVG